ncbi:MAG: alpha/beta hydrolase [Chloroflexota bacterium]
MQRTPIDEIESTPTLIDIGDRCLALYGAGHGEPAVILEAGLTDPAGIWREVQQGVAPFTAAWSYDRAGRGASDAASKPRVVDDAVDDLHALLERAGIGSPYVLVGHSFGGLIVHRYAQRHRELVAGLVLVDSSHPDQTDGILGALPCQGADESDALSFFRASYMEAYEDPSMNVEGFDLAASMKSIGPVRSLGSVPVAILTAESVFDGVELPPDQIERLQGVWFELQSEFSHLSSSVSARVIKGSRHYIFQSHPQEVTSAIRWTVEQARSRT